jgi:hypothetical protein
MRIALAAMAWAGLVMLPVDLPAQQRSERTERVSFARGTTAWTGRGRIRGYEMVDYLVNARAGQVMNVELQPSNRFTYVLVRGPGSEANLYDGSVTGNSGELRLPASGDYRVRVFLFRNAARRGEVSNYMLKIGVS